MKTKPNHYSLSRDKQALESDNRQYRQDAYISACSWRLPFGKYRGKELCSIPLDYLLYIRRNSNNMGTVQRVADEIDRRKRIKVTVLT